MELLKNFAGTVLVSICILLVIMALYVAAGFLAWVAADPLDLFEDGPMISLEGQTYTEGERKWDDCVESTKVIFDNFNDTVGASYALGDTPSTESQEFMKICLELNK